MTARNIIEVSTGAAPSLLILQDSRRENVCTRVGRLEESVRCGAYWLSVETGQSKDVYQISVFPGHPTRLQLEPSDAETALPLSLLTEEGNLLAKDYKRAWDDFTRTKDNLIIFPKRLDSVSQETLPLTALQFSEFDKHYFAEPSHEPDATSIEVKSSGHHSARLSEGTWLIEQKVRRNDYLLGVPVVADWKTVVFSIGDSDPSLSKALVLLFPKGRVYDDRFQAEVFATELILLQLSRGLYDLTIMAYLNAVEKLEACNPVGLIAYVVALIQRGKEGDYATAESELRNLPAELNDLPDIKIARMFLESCRNERKFRSILIDRPPLLSDSWHILIKLASLQHDVIPSTSPLNLVVPLQTTSVWFHIKPLRSEVALSYLRSVIKGALEACLDRQKKTRDSSFRGSQLLIASKLLLSLDFIDRYQALLGLEPTVAAGPPENINSKEPAKKRDIFAEIAGAEETQIKVHKAKGSKNITRGIVHVTATFNNTIVSVTDSNGNTLGWSSAGKMGFKGSRKSTAYAAQVVSQDACRQAMGHGLKEAEVRVKGAGAGRESAVRAVQALGIELLAIKDVTPLPHNGCRPKKARRI